MNIKYHLYMKQSHLETLCRDQVILQFLAVNDVYSLETSSEGVSLDKPHTSTCVFACLFALVSPPDQVCMYMHQVANHTLYMLIESSESCEQPDGHG